MANVEERVVNMQFNSAQFLTGINQSLAALDKLNAKLKTQEGVSGLNNVAGAAQRTVGPLQQVADGVTNLGNRFKTMGVVAMSAINTVTSQGIFALQNAIKGVTLDPIIQGFKEYETNMNSIQTILGNTQAAGTKLKDVTDALDELNHYSDQTIYNFSEMAKNIGTFTAAGVDLKTSVGSIKGIANLAALSGTNSEKASAAMYQLSQAISSGTVSLEDWNSVEAASMGGAVFKKALADTAVAMGVLKKNAVTLEGPMKNITVNGEAFRKSISAAGGKQSWLTSDVLTKTLQQFTGDMTDAQLAAEGFSDTQIKAIQKQAQTARNAATEVKTFTQLLSTVKESVGSGWSQSFKTIFGDFDEARHLFTDINNVVSGIVSRSADARNKMLEDWDVLGGRKAMIEGLGNAFKAIGAVLKPIGQAFRQAFPKQTGADLAAISKAFRDFTKGLIIGNETATNLRTTFAGLFAVVGIGWDALKAFGSMIARLFGVIQSGDGSGFLEFTASIGTWLIQLRQAIRDGKAFENFFQKLGDVLEKVIKGVQKFGDFLADIFGDIDFGGATKAFDGFGKSVKPMESIGNTVLRVWSKVMGVFGKVQAYFLKLGWDIAGTVDKITSKFAELVGGLNFQDVISGVNAGGIVAIAGALWKMVSGGGGGVGGLMDGLNDSIEAFTDTLGAMQNTLRAATLLQIAIAVGILAVAMNTLSKIDQDGLTRSGVAIGALFTQLMGAMLIFEKFSSFTGFAKMPFVAASMILLATAVNILASAMVKLSGLDWNGIAKGLTGVTVLIGALVGAMHLMPKGPTFVLAAAGTILMATAIRILAGAVTEIADLSWEDMARGLTGVAGLLLALNLFARFTTVGIKGAISGAVLFLLAHAIGNLAEALKTASTLSWEEMGRGLAVIASGLALLSGALKLLPPSTLLSAAAIFIAASALSMIGDALKSAGAMSWEEYAKGMATLAGSLVILAGGLYLMETGLPGAAALLVAAASLGMLTDALKGMATLSWEDFGKSMAALGGSMVILSAGLYAMSGSLVGAAALVVAVAAIALLVPVLAALGSLSWGTILTGLGALALTFTVLGVAAALIAPVLPALFGLAASILAIGVAMAAAGLAVALFGAGLALAGIGLAAIAASGIAAASAIVGMLGVILGAIPMIVKIIGQLLVALLDLVIEVAPKLYQAAVVLINGFLNAIVAIAPKIIDTIFKLLTALYNAMLTYVPRLADIGMRLLSAFLQAIANRIGSVVTAGVNIVVNFLNGIADNIGRVVTAGTNIVIRFIKGVGDNASRVANAAAQMIIKFVNSTAQAIRNNSGAMNAAGRNLASAIIEGMTSGIRGGAGAVIGAAKDLAKSAFESAKNFLDINSPSKKFIALGKSINEGFVKGIKSNSKSQIDAAFKDMRASVQSLIDSSKKDMASLQAKLKKLQKDPKKNAKQIKETNAALAQARAEYSKSSKAMMVLNAATKNHQAALDKLAVKYEQVTAKLKAAQDKLNEAIKARDDYRKSVTDQYSDAVDPDKDTKLSDYVAALKKQVADTKTFVNTMAQLRKLGLNDETYKDLIEQGPEVLPFAAELLKGGKKSIDEINSLNKQLDSVGGSFGKSASDALYQAAVNSAAGIVKGLQNQQKAIDAQMDKIADSMVKAIKKKLGIKSPSRVFAEIGDYTLQGLAKGMVENSSTITKSAETVANVAVTSLRKSLTNANKMVGGNLSYQPVIRPVLDLTDIRNNAGRISGMLPGDAKLSVMPAYSQAVGIASQIGGRTGGGSDGRVQAMPNVQYVQNNYSPKAISAADTYRNTRNQLSAMKGALSTSVNK